MAGPRPGARAEIQSLRERIEQHDHRYYVLDDPLISDAEYDQLLKQLIKLEEQHPEYQSAHSPTRRVGGRVAGGFAPVAHPVPMMSLANAMQADEVHEFDRRVREFAESNAPIEYTAEPKIDGLAVSLRFEHGWLARAATRGDGRTGEDITQNMRQVLGEDTRLHGKPPSLLEVRGEVFMKLADFERLNREQKKRDEKQFVNPRNAAAGSLRQLDPAITARRPLSYEIYAIGETSADKLPNRYPDLLEWIGDFGIPISKERRCVKGAEGCIEYYESLQTRRDNLAYEIDGVVYKVARRDWQHGLGATAKSPRWALAHKFPPAEMTTRVRAIDLQVGRTGAVTPVARLDPVFVGGVTVSNATLHNRAEIERLDVRVGDRVWLRRAGDVIPEIVRILPEERPKSARPFVFPDACPVCDTPIVYADDGVIARCSGGLFCPAQRKGLLRHFVSRKALDIEGCGERLIEELVDSGRVSEVADLYNLKQAELAELVLAEPDPDARTKSGKPLAARKVGKKVAAKLIRALDESRDTELPRFLFGLGIPLVGETTAETLALHFGDLDPIIAADQETLEQVPDIGPLVAKSIRTFFDQPHNRRVIERLRKVGLRWPAVTRHAPTDTALSGKKVVITGTLSAPRPEIKKTLQALGAVVSAQVSKNTDYLLAGENPGSKATKAEELGVPLLTEAEYRKICAAAGVDAA